MALLANVLSVSEVISSNGIPVGEVNEVQIDSRKVKPGAAFIAVKGTLADGHSFIDTAINNGAVVIICESLPQNMRENIYYIVVHNTARAAGIMKHNFYGQLSKKIKLVGVTGTNGKTTIATLLFKLFIQLGYKCGLLSTVQNQVNDKI